MSKLQKWVPTTNLMNLRRLGKTGEEVNELGAICARCIIQGLDGIDPKTGEMNLDKLADDAGGFTPGLQCVQVRKIK